MTQDRLGIGPELRKVLVSRRQRPHPVGRVRRAESRNRLGPVEPVVAVRQDIGAVTLDEIEVEDLRGGAHESAAQVRGEPKRRRGFDRDVSFSDLRRSGVLLVGITDFPGFLLDPADDLGRMPQHQNIAVQSHDLSRFREPRKIEHLGGQHLLAAEPEARGMALEALFDQPIGLSFAHDPNVSDSILEETDVLLAHRAVVVHVPLAS